MGLTLRSRSFRVERANLGAALFRPYWKKGDPTQVLDKLWWSLTISCSERTFDGTLWEPRLEFERFLLPIGNWLELENLATQVNGGKCYVVGHDSVSATEVRFGKRTGFGFQLTCAGKCDVNWDDEFGTDVPFSISTRVRFDGVRVVGTSGDDDDSLRDFLEAHFGTDALSAEPCRECGSPRSGKKMIEKLFVPKRVR
jgi:hypothetical protein